MTQFVFYGRSQTERVGVKDSKEMNRGLIERADVFVVLAGGVGTLNELTDVLRMVKNGLLDKRVVVVNTDGFYESFSQQLQRMRAEGFVEQRG